MALTCHLDYSQPSYLWNDGTMSTLVSADGDLIRLTQAIAPANRGSYWGVVGPNAVPLYRTAANGENGLSVGELDPSNNRHGIWISQGGAGVGFTAYLTLADLIANNAFTAMFVFKQTADSVSGNSGTTNSGVRIWEDTGLNVSLRTFTNAGVQELYGVNAGNVLGPVAFTRDIPQLATLRHSGGNLYLSANGGSESSIASGNTGSLASNVWFGVSFPFGGYFPGRFCEFKIWNTGDADGAQTSEQNGLLSKWGISGGGGGSEFPALTVAI